MERMVMIVVDGPGIKRPRGGLWMSALFLLTPFLSAAATISLLAVAAAPARGQCLPQELAKLIPSDAGDAFKSRFGVSVAVSGRDRAVVGSYHDDHAGGADAGAAYVFVRTGGIWTQEAKLTACDAAPNDALGYSVAVSDDGDTVLVAILSDNRMKLL